MRAARHTRVCMCVCARVCVCVTCRARARLRSSRIKRKVMKYNDKLDDFDLLDM